MNTCSMYFICVLLIIYFKQVNQYHSVHFKIIEVEITLFRILFSVKK